MINQRLMYSELVPQGGGRGGGGNLNTYLINRTEWASRKTEDRVTAYKEHMIESGRDWLSWQQMRVRGVDMVTANESEGRWQGETADLKEQNELLIEYREN